MSIADTTAEVDATAGFICASQVRVVNPQKADKAVGSLFFLVTQGSDK
jgi:hypothetical protein